MTKAARACNRAPTRAQPLDCQTLVRPYPSRVPKHASQGSSGEWAARHTFSTPLKRREVAVDCGRNDPSTAVRLDEPELVGVRTSIPQLVHDRIQAELSQALLRQRRGAMTI